MPSQHTLQHSRRHHSKLRAIVSFRFLAAGVRRPLKTLTSYVVGLSNPRRVLQRRQKAHNLGCSPKLRLVQQSTQR